MKQMPVLTSRFQHRTLLPFGTALILIIAGLLGCLAIYSSRSFADEPLNFVFRQLFWLCPGILLFLAAAAVPFRIYRKIALPGLILSLLALSIVLFREIGITVNGMRGWFDLGILHVQPSEFAKTAFLLYLCVYCGPRKELNGRQWLGLFLLGGITAGLVMAEPDFGGALMFFVIFMLISLLRGVRFQYLLIAAGVMLTATVFFLLSNEYAFLRVLGYLDPDGAYSASAWHIKQFQYTLAHGGWTGSDWGNALWSGAFLPLPHTDSLFASIVESTGFLGGLAVIAGFLFMAGGFCALSWKVRGGNDDRRFFIFAAGTVCLIQALIHISVNCVLIPPTGVTLPILSYGGSSLFAVLLTFGIAFSAARSEENEDDA